MTPYEEMHSNQGAIFILTAFIDETVEAHQLTGSTNPSLEALCYENTV